MKEEGKLKNTVLYNLAVIFIYATSGFLGLMLAVPPGYATPIWVPSGIALGSLLVWGLTTLPGIFLGSFFLNFYITYNNDGYVFDLLNLFTGIITGTGAILQALFGWWLVKYFVKLNNPLHLPKDILIFALLTGPVSCVVAATISSVGLYSIGLISPENFSINWVTWWIGDSIGVLIFTPVFLVSFAKPAILWRSRTTPILLPLCLTFFIVILSHIVYSQSELRRVQLKFFELTQYKLNHLTNELKLTTETANAITLFLSTTPKIKKEDFEHDGALLLQENPTIQSIQWVPKISNRDDFEKKYHLKIIDNITGNNNPSQNKSVYYPILFMVSKNTPTFPLGYDLSSNLKLTELLNLNTRKNVPVFSIIPRSRDTIDKVYMSSAIYRDGKFTGFAILEINLLNLFNKTFKNFLNYSNLTIQKSSSDINKQPLFEIYSKNTPKGHTRLLNVSYKNYFAGSTWDIHATSSTSFITHEYSWQVWSSLVTTLLFCVLMNIILFFLYGQRYLIQYLVDAKTMQLKTEKAKNLLLLNAALEGIFWIDVEYKITFINPAAEKILGYSSDELKDKSIVKILNEQITAPPAYQIENSSIYQAMENKTVIKAKEALFWTKQGTSFWVEYTCIPIIINNLVKGAAIIFSDISERLENENKLKKMAHFDPLTKLPNRMSFFEYLEHAIARAVRNDTQLGVCYIDVDNFKNVNDTFGHIYGDKLLTLLPILITPYLRDIDYLARIGGDEFGLILEETHKINDLAKTFERILSVFANPIKIEDREIKTSISIGVAIYPKNGIDSETLLMNADIAMYQAKSKGKSTFSFFSEKANEKVLIYNKIDSALQKAIKEKRYEVYYQPLLDTLTHKILGVEALLRWNDEELNRFPLTDSILIAEDEGFIYELGQLVLERSFKDYQQIAKNRDGIQLAINTSIQQIKHPAFTALIRALLNKHPINPSLIYFEIKETAFNKDSDVTIDIMMGLKSLGVQFALDDFGVGYSSIHLLKKLPVSYLKIDRSLINDIEKNSDDATLVLTSINLSHGLGIKTIAEGVEKVAQLDLLTQWGCNIIQGYYFAQPMPLNQLLRWMKIHDAAIKNNNRV